MNNEIKVAKEAALEAGFDIERLLTNGNPFSDKQA